VKHFPLSVTINRKKSDKQKGRELLIHAILKARQGPETT
jgi:hypothetical protein